MKNSLLAAALLMVGGSASAAPFYLDIGTDFSATDSDQACPTCTSVKDEFLFTYESTTLIDDTDGSGTINAGDALTTDGGLAVGGLANNQITGFTPNQTFGANSNNGYGSDWLISFSIEDLDGVVTGVSPGDVPLFNYFSGDVLELFLTFDGVTFNNFMDVIISGGGATGVSTILTGSADFSDVDAGFNNLFHSTTFECMGSSGFFDIWSNCGEGAGDALAINFFSSFDTNIFVSDFDFDPDTGVFSLTSDHDGSGTFTIPEPGTLALLGGSMLLLSGFKRRKKA